MANDPDAGVRRELILAFRSLATEQVGDSLRRLATAWDGQDRWYLEALGLALEKRESNYLSALFDGGLYGTFDLEKAGMMGDVARPPYFPVDRNEAFIPIGAPDRRITSVSKYLGLAWRIHHRTVLPFLERLLPQSAVELQQAADDTLERMSDPQTAELVARIAMQVNEPVYQQRLLALLARRLGGDWHVASERPEVVKVIEGTLARSETRLIGIALATATRDRRYRMSLKNLAEDARMPDEIRVNAVEGLALFSGQRGADGRAIDRTGAR